MVLQRHPARKVMGGGMVSLAGVKINISMCRFFSEVLTLWFFDSPCLNAD